ncbi:MAG: hypothetical protein JRG93_14035 [Deltaproteobacteria bacterium]|nr:hypothetical protein [Deltaproteobacteria bacterium]
MNTEHVEQRHDVVLRNGVPATRTADALQPLAEAVRGLDVSFDRLANRIEGARRAEASKRLTALVDGAVQNLYATVETERRDKESDRLHLRLTGKKRPPTHRTIGQHIFGDDYDPNESTLHRHMRSIFGDKGEN